MLSHCCQFLSCLFSYWEDSAQFIFTYSSKHHSFLGALGSFGWVWSTEALSTSLKLLPGELNYSLALQCHVHYRALTLGHMRSNDYSTTKIFVDNFLLYLYFIFIFMHLADAFIQSDLHCIQVTVSTFFFISSCFPWESNPWSWRC